MIRVLWENLNEAINGEIYEVNEIYNAVARLQDERRCPLGPIRRKNSRNHVSEG
ncbi:MAG: hypothetical protein QXN24_00235 [Candidatus Bathyarchaeia archaeon]